MLVDYWAARVAGLIGGWRPGARSAKSVGAPRKLAALAGISVVIPSRNGKYLLDAQLPGIVRDLEGTTSEVIVVDNGSDDGTAAWLGEQWPAVVTVVSTEPLGFARAVNRGIARARYGRICLLNNDMLLEPGFFAALEAAFARTPELFCATAQIRFPAGVRREETGKAVIRQESPLDFPVRCDEPLPGEDGTWVLYGSGGCSLYDAEKLRTLGGVDEAYDPAYVEDLDLGYRAWLHGWPSVYVAGALVEHRHRATTSRYYTEEQLADVLEINYLKFLARAVESRALFRRLWRQDLDRLRATRRTAALRAAAGIALRGRRKDRAAEAEEMLLALTDGSVACFPGRGTGAPVVVASERLEPPPEALLEHHGQVVMVRGAVDSAAYRAAESRVLGLR